MTCSRISGLQASCAALAAATMLLHSTVGVAAQDNNQKEGDRAMQHSRPRQIMAYAGYANSETVWVQGRVLANKLIRGPDDDDNWWDNLRATYERWETDELADVDVELLYGAQQQVVTSNDEGYYFAQFELDNEFPQDDVVIARARGKNGRILAQHPITLVDPDAEFMVISDMDDTVIHTGITNTLIAARSTFLRNAKTRKPLDGVAGLYRALQRGMMEDARNPIFYVSNSGWNMYDLLREFIDLNDIPRGPILLRDWGINFAEDTTKDHKASTFRELLRRYPGLPAILIGDSGQHDAALYASLAHEFPDRILAIYIRDVDPDHDSAFDAKVDAFINDGTYGGVPMLRGRDSDSFARHLQSINLLPIRAEPVVAASVQRDKSREDPAEVSTK